MSRLFNQAALQARSIPELQALFQAEMHALVCSEDHSQDRRDALSNLDRISRVIAQKRCTGPRI